MIIVISYIDVVFVVNCYVERGFKFVFFVVILFKLMKCWVNVGIFLVVDNKYSEGVFYDWFVLNSDRDFMFIIYFWYVSYSVGVIFCNRND